jgi:hypothetical protein
LLTDYHSLRYDAHGIGRGSIISIMLDELSSCAMVRRRCPALLVLAAITGIIALSPGANGYNPSPMFVFGIATAISLAAYFLTKQNVVEFASSGASIRLTIGALSAGAIRPFIN